MNIEEQAKNKINGFYRTIDSKNYLPGSIDKKQYNYEFTVTNSGTKDKIKVQVYFGKKGIKTVIQGNKESKLYRDINNLINDQKVLDFAEKSGEEFDEYIGSDETGKGDLFGPLVVCAYYCRAEDKEILVNAGVKDSKELSAFQINQTAEFLINKFRDKFSVVIITPEKYNELYSNFRNLNKMLNWAHSTALSNLTEIHTCKNIIVDKFSNESIKLTNGNAAEFNIIQTHKAERFAGVAAASIIARYKFDRWFEDHSRFNLIKGASSETAKIAEKIFDNYGVDELKKVAKLHFKSINKLIV